MNDKCTLCEKELTKGEDVMTISEWKYLERNLGEPATDYLCMDCYNQIVPNFKEKKQALVDLLMTAYDVADDGIKEEYEDLTGRSWNEDDPLYRDLQEECRDWLYAKTMRVDDLCFR